MFTFTASTNIVICQTKKSQVLNMEVKALEPNRLRMDITSTLGHHVFSLVSTGNQVEYLLVRQKKHYKGASSERALRPVLKVPIDPAHLKNVIFQRPIADKDWSCTTDKKAVRDCINMRTKMKVEWQQGKDYRPMINISYAKAVTIQINVRAVEDFNGEADKVFALKVPKSFKSYRLK